MGGGLVSTKSSPTATGLCLAQTWFGSQVKWETKGTSQGNGNPKSLALAPFLPGTLEPTKAGFKPPSITKAASPNTFTQGRQEGVRKQHW